MGHNEQILCSSTSMYPLGGRKSLTVSLLVGTKEDASLALDDMFGNEADDRRYQSFQIIIVFKPQFPIIKLKFATISPDFVPNLENMQWIQLQLLHAAHQPMMYPTTQRQQSAGPLHP